jgi:hypothetical protein
VLGRIFGPNREEMAGGWRILHNEELHNYYYYYYYYYYYCYYYYSFSLEHRASTTFSC